ncbi:ATP-dependent helicase [Leifsonella bigeumensis]|uniref:ATP-dependent helicase n=1 Tax=Leifsonella bigeumensis TaxID=433643 RepID=UPI0031E29D5C
MARAPVSAESLLEGLDPEQRVAVESLLGPVCLLAGAGTGKTRAITHRIAYGVANGVYSEGKVMALTFTTRAAGELRTRLRGLGAGGVASRTFHAAALSQLAFFWPQVVGGTMPRILEGKARLLGQVAESLRMRVDTAALRDLAAEVEWRKVSGLGIEEYATAGRTPPGSLSTEQVVALQQGYENLKDDRRQLDFEDVLLACAGMIDSEPRVAQQVREQYRFFVVDEYQDVSPLQQRLLELWLGDREDLCVVGDASQTIYSFAGASPEFLLGFPRRYPDAMVVRLERNYRSTPAIVDAANRLMRGRAGALTLTAAAASVAAPPAEVATIPSAAPSRTVSPPPSAAPTIDACRSDTEEARGVASRIGELIAGGAKPQDIAVLYRINVQSVALGAALDDAGVSYQVRGGTRFFDLPEIKQAIMMLKGATIVKTDEQLFRTVSDVLRSLGWTQEPPESRGAVRSRWESLNTLMLLAEDQPPGTGLAGFVAELLERSAGQHEPTMAAVTLATLHSAKGLEWDTVFLVGLQEGLVPIGYASTPEAIDEERRLLYVGLTRARKRLHLSWSASNGQRSGENRPSRFLAELAR